MALFLRISDFSSPRLPCPMVYRTLMSESMGISSPTLEEEYLEASNIFYLEVPKLCSPYPYILY